MQSNEIITITYDDNGTSKAVSLFAENITYDNSSEETLTGGQRIRTGILEDNATIDFETRPVFEKNDPNKLKNLFYKLAGVNENKGPYFSLKIDFVVDTPRSQVVYSRRWQDCVLRKDVGIANFTLGDRMTLSWAISCEGQGEWI